MNTITSSLRQQCVAHSRAGRRCRNSSILGGTVCRMHGGGTPQVKRKALERVTLAQALASGDRRPPYEVITSALGAADAIMNDLLVRVQNDDGVDAAQMTKFVEAIERAARLAKMTIDGKFIEAHNRQVQLDGEEMAGVLLRALDRVDLTDVQRWALRAALADELLALDEGRPASREPVRAIAGVAAEGSIVPTGESDVLDADYEPE